MDDPLCLAQPAEPRSGWAKEPPEERAVELSRTLESRRYLEGGCETEDVAALLVEAAGSLSMHTSVSLGTHQQLIQMHSVFLVLSA